MNPVTKEKIENLIKEHQIVLFMKGTPETPMCGFSAVATNVLNNLHAQFGTYDILKDPEVRQGIKEYSNWPTIPQLYIDGRFVGGSDIMQELHENGELKEMVENMKTISSS